MEFVDRYATGLKPLSLFRSALLPLLIAIHSLFLTSLGLFRHWGYLTSLNDLGVFDQAVWGIVNGYGPLNTSIFSSPANWLGFHFNPILLLFVPLYAIYPAAEWFVFAQAAALSLTAWPVFLLASRVTKSERVGMQWAIVYLLNPFVFNAAAWDFHPVTLAVPLIAAGFLAVEKQEAQILLLCCAALLLVQEQMGLTIFGFGLLWWLKTRDWKVAVALMALGLAHFYLVLAVVMPAFSPSGTHVMLAKKLGHLSRYGWLGSSIGEIIESLFLHPLTVLKPVLLMAGAIYALMLSLPFLGLSFLAPMFLLPGMGDFAANVLSTNLMQRWGGSYHNVTLVPTFLAAAVYGARVAAPRLAKVSFVQLPTLVIVVSTVLAYVLSPLPLLGALDPWSPKHFANAPDPNLDLVHAIVEGHDAVSVQGNIGAHFSQRKEVYFYPSKVGEAKHIVLRLESPTKRIKPLDPATLGTLSHHLQMQPADYIASIECLVFGNEYGVVMWQNPWLVLSKKTSYSINVNSVKQKLDALSKEWNVSPENYPAALKQCL